MRGLSPSVAVGLVLLADSVAANLALRADETHVWFLSRAIPWQCALRSQAGVPCPTCGLTRSIVMSLHGEFLRAWHLAPAGPVAVIGATAMALALIALPWMKRSFAAVWLRRSGLAYGLLTVVLWLGGWAVAFRAALKH